MSRFLPKRNSRYSIWTLRFVISTWLFQFDRHDSWSILSAIQNGRCTASETQHRNQVGNQSDSGSKFPEWNITAWEHVRNETPRSRRWTSCGGELRFGRLIAGLNDPGVNSFWYFCSLQIEKEKDLSLRDQLSAAIFPRRVTKLNTLIRFTSFVFRQERARRIRKLCFKKETQNTSSPDGCFVFALLCLRAANERPLNRSAKEKDSIKCAVHPFGIMESEKEHTKRERFTTDAAKHLWMNSTWTAAFPSVRYLQNIFYLCAPTACHVDSLFIFYWIFSQLSLSIGGIDKDRKMSVLPLLLKKKNQQINKNEKRRHQNEQKKIPAMMF